MYNFNPSFYPIVSTTLPIPMFICMIITSGIYLYQRIHVYAFVSHHYFMELHVYACVSKPVLYIFKLCILIAVLKIFSYVCNCLILKKIKYLFCHKYPCILINLNYFAFKLILIYYLFACCCIIYYM